MTEKYHCIICEDGDPYSNVVCDACECSIEHRKEVYESMVSLVHDINGIFGDVPFGLCNEIKNKVDPIYNMLIDITIKDTRKK